MVAPGGSVIQGCFLGGLSELQRRTFGIRQSPVVQRAVIPDAKDFPSDPIPAHEDPPYDRDRLLPKADYDQSGSQEPN